MTRLYTVICNTGSGRGMASDEIEVFHTKAVSGEQTIKKVIRHQYSGVLPPNLGDFEENETGHTCLWYDGASWEAYPVGRLI
jgi:hypothetical protein